MSAKAILMGIPFPDVCRSAKYGLLPEDYNNYLRAVDRGRRKLIPVTYDPNWIEKVYLPKHMILCEALKRRAFPYV
mgnify:CR=1 FL=1